MIMSLAEILDRYSILLLKSEYGLAVDDELAEYAEKVDSLDPTLLVDFHKLSGINRKMWQLEELVTRETDLEKIGAYCLALRGLTVLRTKQKNLINSEQDNPRERKSY